MFPCCEHVPKISDVSLVALGWMRSLVGSWGRLAAPTNELAVEPTHFFFQTLESGCHHIREYPCTRSLLILQKKKRLSSGTRA